MYISEETVVTEGIASKIEKILGKSRYYFPRLLEHMWIFYIPLIPLFVGLVLLNSWLMIVGGSLVLLVIIWMAIEFQFITNLYNKIFFHYKKDAPNFWKQNKSQIILLIIGAVIGIIGTIIVTIITNTLQ